MSFGHLRNMIWHRWTIICGDKCYADKPETIDALKDNIREAILKFLKIALTAAELISFDHLEAAIWHRWTIICEGLSKISVTSTSQL